MIYLQYFEGGRPIGFPFRPATHGDTAFAGFRKVVWNKTGTLASAMLYVDNRGIAEGSLSRRRPRAYRVVVKRPAASPKAKS